MCVVSVCVSVFVLAGVELEIIEIVIIMMIIVKINIIMIIIVTLEKRNKREMINP